MQGLWGDSQETCRTLNEEGAIYVGGANEWLKITKTDVLGTTQGRFFQEGKAMMVDMSPAKYSVLIQTGREVLQLVDLTVSLDGKLFETIVGARASGVYVRCQ
jgi:hypothetical protein